jgi:hypothetical protein
MYGYLIDERLRHQKVMCFDGGDGRMDRTYPLAEFNGYQVRDVWRQKAVYEGLNNFSEETREFEV